MKPAAKSHSWKRSLSAELDWSIVAFFEDVISSLDLVLWFDSIFISDPWDCFEFPEQEKNNVITNK